MVYAADAYSIADSVLERVDLQLTCTLTRPLLHLSLLQYYQCRRAMDHRWRKCRRQRNWFCGAMHCARVRRLRKKDIEEHYGDLKVCRRGDQGSGLEKRYAYRYSLTLMRSKAKQCFSRRQESRIRWQQTCWLCVSCGHVVLAYWCSRRRQACTHWRRHAVVQTPSTSRQYYQRCGRGLGRSLCEPSTVYRQRKYTSLTTLPYYDTSTFHSTSAVLSWTP